MKIVKHVRRNERSPRFYALCRWDYMRDEAVVAPVGINLIIGVWFSLWAFMQNCWRSICISRYDAYQQGVNSIISLAVKASKEGKNNEPH